MNFANNSDGKIIANRVLFQCSHGSHFSGSPFYMLKELSLRGTHECYVAAKDKRKIQGFLDSHHINARALLTTSKEYFRVAVTARYIIDSTTMPGWWSKQEGQTYVNTWHGVPLKTLGTTSPHALSEVLNVSRCFRQADILCHPNMYTHERIDESYMLHNSYSKISLICGSPKNSILLNSEQRDILREITSLDGKFVYLYMPTWRGKNMKSIEGREQIAAVQKILTKVESHLPNDAVFLVKFHPFVSSEVDFSQFKKIMQVPELLETSELMCIADCLVTDYSSAMFDYSVTKRPIALFTYDSDLYLRDRALYFPLEELPFQRFETTESLVSAISESDISGYTPEYQDFINHYMPYESENAAALLSTYIFGDIGDVSAKEFPHEIYTRACEVDVVIMPSLGPHGQKMVNEFINSLAYSASTLFVFPFAQKFMQASNEYLYDLINLRGIPISFAGMNGKMNTSRMDDFVLVLNKKYGLFQKEAVEIYSREFDRLFTGLSIRSLSTFSKARKALMLCKVFEQRGNSVEYCFK